MTDKTNKKYKALVAEVIPGSIAEEMEITTGDIILSIDGKELQDLIDYNEVLFSEQVVVLVEKNDGSGVEELVIEKEFDEDLGIIFESAVFDKIKPCLNNCIFCFVNQQPKGMRDTLYIKDDDYRLSYLQGTYVTLTNLTEADKTRIKEKNLSPLYVSVHTTNPELRATMLRNPNASKIMDNLKWLADNDILFHTQVVLCPGYNDENELERTLNDIGSLKDSVLSIAVVPVGLTKYRDLPLKKVDKTCATKTIEIIDKFNEKMKRPLACASDEFFLLANKPIPPTEYYNEFAQLEDGVGALRLILDDFEKRRSELPTKLDEPKKISLVTSEAAASVFTYIAQEFNKIENLEFNLEIIKCNFWGEDVNVTGLIVAQDIIEQLSPKKSDIDIIALPSVMLKPLSETFLDDLTVNDVTQALDCEAFIIEDIYSTEELISLILD